MKILAERLRALRKEQKLRQADVAQAVGIAPFTYQRYEYGERDPDAPVLAAMATFFHVSADYLLGLKEER